MSCLVACKRETDSGTGAIDQMVVAEYFSPTTGTGHGAPEFSWTAALTVDLTYEPPDQEGPSSRSA